MALRMMGQLRMKDKGGDKIGLVLGSALALMMNGSTTKDRLGERKRSAVHRESNGSLERKLGATCTTWRVQQSRNSCKEGQTTLAMDKMRTENMEQGVGGDNHIGEPEIAHDVE